MGYTFSNIGTIKASGEVVKPVQPGYSKVGSISSTEPFVDTVKDGAMTPIYSDSLSAGSSGVKQPSYELQNNPNKSTSSSGISGMDATSYASMGVGALGAISSGVGSGQSTGRTGLNVVKSALPALGPWGMGGSAAIGLGEALYDNGQAKKKAAEDKEKAQFSQRKGEFDRTLDFSSSKQYNNSMYGNSYALGSNVSNQEGNKNQMIDFKGQPSHSDGGFMLNKSSNAEGQELMHGNYIFSDRIPYK